MAIRTLGERVGLLVGYTAKHRLKNGLVPMQSPTNNRGSRVRFAFSPFLVVLCAIATFAQTQSVEEMPRLTNKEIVGMVEAGMSSAVIVAKI